jgi:hypothetical protein
MEIFSKTGKSTSLEFILAGCLVSESGLTDIPTVSIQPVGEPVLVNFPRKPSEIVTTTPIKGKLDEPVLKN